jgi:hypothetical protein
MLLYLRLIGVGLVGYAALVFLGWLPWRWLLAGREVLPFALGAPLFGFAVLTGFGWYWLEFGTGGLAVGLPVLFAATGFASIVALVRSGPRAWHYRPDLRRGASVAVLALLVFGGLALHYSRPLGGGRLTAAAIGNNDIAAYSVISEGLRHQGYQDRGLVAGSDLGPVARVDASGADILLGSSAEITGLGVYETSIPIVGLAALLVALASALLAERILPGSPIRSAAIGLAAIAPYIFVYNAADYFLAQILSIAPVIAMLVVYLNVAEHRDRGSLLRGVGTVGLLMLPVVLTYPHMAVLSQPLVLIIACLAAGFRGALRRAGRLFVCAAGGLAAAATMAAPAVGGAIERARQLADVNAGWPLSLFSPFQMLGLQRFPSMIDITTPGPSTKRYLLELFVVGLLALASTAVLMLRKRPRPWLGGLTVLVVIVSYRAIYQQQGYSYRSWKWLSFFQPMFSAALVALLCAAAAALIDRSSLPRAAVRAAGLLAIGLWIGVLTLNARTLTEYNTWNVADRELVGLDSVGRYRLGSVNIDLMPYWESMWAAYFVAPARSYIVAESYYARSAPSARWTVSRITGGSADQLPGSVMEVVKLTRTYELVCRRRPCDLR